MLRKSLKVTSRSIEINSCLKNPTEKNREMKNAISRNFILFFFIFRTTRTDFLLVKTKIGNGIMARRNKKKSNRNQLRKKSKNPPLPCPPLLQILKLLPIIISTTEPEVEPEPSPEILLLNKFQMATFQFHEKKRYQFH